MKQPVIIQLPVVVFERFIPAHVAWLQFASAWNNRHIQIVFLSDLSSLTVFVLCPENESQISNLRVAF